MRIAWSRDLSDIKKLQNPWKKFLLVFYNSISILRLKYFPEKNEKNKYFKIRKGNKISILKTFSTILFLSHPINLQTDYFLNRSSPGKYLSSLKGTVKVISSNHPCKDDNAGFTMIPLIPFSDNKFEKFCQFSWLKSN